jgi:protein-tyrosine-phosphatase
MSAAFFNQFADPKLALAISAGTQPAEHVHPVVVEAMLEVGIDLNAAKPKKLTAELAQNADMLITMDRCGDRQDVPHEFVCEGFFSSARTSVAVDPTIGAPLVFTESENLSLS